MIEWGIKTMKDSEAPGYEIMGRMHMHGGHACIG